jgi:hypothetical protein
VPLFNTFAKFSLISNAVPLDDLWPEIESYVHSLFPAVSDDDLDESLLISLSNAPDLDMPAEALIDLLSIYAAHPANLLSDCASAALVKLIVAKDPSANRAIKSLLLGDEVDQERALIIVDSVSQREQGTVAVFEPELQSLTDSPNIAVRLVARRLREQNGIRVERDTANQGIPSLYDLALPPGSDIEEIWRRNERSGFDFLPDTDDPYELLMITLTEIKLAASEAGVPEENLVHRTAQIARELALKDRWSGNGEQWLRNRLNSAGLEYPYRRPRSMVARRAFFHVVGELVDLELLGPANIRRMKPVLDYYDPAAFFIEPDATPTFAYRMPDRQQARRDLVLDKAEFPKLTTEDRLVIFGQYSKAKRLEWELPTVVMQTMIAPSGSDLDDDRESFFPREIYWLIKDYPQLSSGHSPKPILIWEEGQMRMFDSPNPVWLAFNPEIARSLGWSYDPRLLFGWVNREGKPAVWSVWWKDGIYQTRPPRLNETVGEGWAVLGTRDALTKLQALLVLPLSQFIRIERSRTEDRQRKVTVHRDERPLLGITEMVSARFRTSEPSV